MASDNESSIGKDLTPNPYSVKYDEIVDRLLKESVEDFEKSGKCKCLKISSEQKTYFETVNRNITLSV